MAELEEFLGQTIEGEALPPQRVLKNKIMTPPMVTLNINLGKKQKLRPGNILGSLTGPNGIDGKEVGKIHIFDNSAYVAITHKAVKDAQRILDKTSWKGRSMRGWLIQR